MQASTNLLGLLTGCMLSPIARRHAVYSDATRVYMLMGYVPGGELFSHLQARGACSAASRHACMQPMHALF